MECTPVHVEGGAGVDNRVKLPKPVSSALTVLLRGTELVAAALDGTCAGTTGLGGGA